MAPRSHLIIQGPLLSFYSPECPPNDASASRLVNGKPAYDANDDVLQTVLENRDAFDTITLATWEDEPLTCEDQLRSQGVIVRKVPTAKVAKVRNQYKQVVGVCDAMEQIDGLAPDDRITKTRTDLRHNLRAYVEHCQRLDDEFDDWRKAGQRGFIHVPCSLGPYHLHDLFVSARASDFQDFWSASLPAQTAAETVARLSTCAAFPGKQSAVHLCLPIEYAWRHRQKLGLANADFWEFARWASPLHNIDKILDENRLWRFLAMHCFAFAPRFRGSEMIWRGGEISDATNRARFSRQHYLDEWRMIRSRSDALFDYADHAYIQTQRRRGLRDRLTKLREASRISLRILDWRRAAAWYDRLLYGARS